MADLNNTIVRGKLRVTEDINANGNITGNGITLSSVKNAGILGTDSSGNVYNNSSAYQPKGNYVTTDKAGTISATKTFSSTPVLSTLKNKKVLGTDANGIIEAHTLGISDIANLQSNLDGKAPKSHTHAISDVTNLQSILNEKANSSHTHSISQITNLQSSLDEKASKSDLNNYQPKGNYVTTDTDQTITGRKTFNSPANVNGQEVATAIFKTSNGGQLIIGKEGPNSGTMLRFDQTAGTTRLQFRASATPGAMVWTQPEKGATLYFDLTNSAGVSTRTTLDARSGKIARTSDIKNGKITIQKNGTEVGSFTTNQSESKTIDLTLGVSDVSGLQSTLDGKMDTYTITNEPSSMGKDGFAQFGYDVSYQLTQYYQLSKAFGYVKVLEKGGQVSNNNSYFTGFGDVGGGTYIGTAIYDRDYNSTTGALYTSHGLLIDAYGSAFLLSGSRDSETIKRIATTDDTNSLQNSIDGKQATLVSGTNIRTINGTSILGGGNISVVASLAEKEFHDIINSTSSQFGYAVIDKLLIQWGVFIGAHGDTTNWEVTYPKTFYWYPSVILQTKDTNTNNQGLPYSNGAVITNYNNGTSFTFQLRRSESCPVYWIAIGGLR